MTAPDLLHILAGVDATGLADGALRAALELARRLPARLELVHALELPPRDWLEFAPLAPDAAEREALAARRSELEEHVQELFDAAGVVAHTAAESLHVVRGTPAQVLVERARERSSALIVLGPHRRRGLFDFGGTARGVLAEAPCDLWMQPVEFVSPERLLVPVDLSEPSLEALRRALALASRLGARLSVLHCHQAPALLYAPTNLGYPVLAPGFDEEALRSSIEARYRQVLAGVDWRGVEHEVLFVEGEPTAAIRERAGDFDLVVLGSHGRTGLARAVLGSVAYTVLKHAEVPVLVVRGPARDWLL